MNRLLCVGLVCVASLVFAKPAKKVAPKQAQIVDAGLPAAGVVIVDAGVAAAPPQPKVTRLAIVVEEVMFHSTTPMSTIDGKTKSMDATTDGEFVTLSVPVDTVDTGIGLRNGHMRNYLEATKFPNAELKVRSEALKEGMKQDGVGTFTVHGVSREVKVTFDVSKTSEGLKVKGSFPINLKQHAIAVPTYLGITVRPDVMVSADFVVTSK